LKNTLEQTRADMKEQLTVELNAAKTQTQETLASERKTNEALTDELNAIKARNEALTAELNAIKATNEALTAELNALKMQIQPHYLYNTLDMIRMSALSQNDAETARLIESLSRQLRYMMGTHQDKVTLRQELDNLQEYSILMSTRSEGRIRIRMEAADCDLGLYIPKLLLQPFVENAVKHGLKDKPDGGTILIEAIRLPDTLQIMIFNDGKPIEPERLNHIRTFLETSPLGAKDEGGIVSIGMKNTYDRIKINCGNEYGFTIDSDETAGVVVTIRLPIWKEEKGYEEGPSGR